MFRENSTETIYVNDIYSKNIRNMNDGTVVYILPDQVNWLKTSQTGKFIFDSLAKEPRTFNEIVNFTAKYYDLPSEAIYNMMKNFVTELFNSNMAFYKNQSPSVNYFEMDKVELQQVWINITSYCNLKCDFCYVPLTKNSREHIRESTFYKLTEEAKKLCVLEIIISGGEPTLHPNFNDFIENLRKNFSGRIKVITNGSLLNIKHKEEIIPLIDDIQISVDGATEEIHDQLRGRGSFNQILRLAGYLSQNHPDKIFGISFTPNKINLHQISQLFEFSLRIKNKYIHLNRPKKPGIFFTDKPEKNIVEDIASKELFITAIEEYIKLLNIIYSDQKEIEGFEIKNQLNLDKTFDPGSDLLTNFVFTKCRFS